MIGATGVPSSLWVRRQPWCSAAYACSRSMPPRYAVVTEFGKPVQVVTEPGLRFKFPYQSVHTFDRRLFAYTPPATEFLTLEKTPVVASSTIIWRIADPRRFFETVFDRAGAESRLGDILFAELGAAIGQSPLAAFVSLDPGAYRADAVLAEVTPKVPRGCAAGLRHRGGRRAAAEFGFPQAEPRPRLRADAVGARPHQHEVPLGGRGGRAQDPRRGGGGESSHPVRVRSKPRSSTAARARARRRGSTRRRSAPIPHSIGSCARWRRLAAFIQKGTTMVLPAELRAVRGAVRRRLL